MNFVNAGRRSLTTLTLLIYRTCYITKQTYEQFVVNERALHTFSSYQNTDWGGFRLVLYSAAVPVCWKNNFHFSSLTSNEFYFCFFVLFIQIGKNLFSIFSTHYWIIRIVKKVSSRHRNGFYSSINKYCL